MYSIKKATFHSAIILLTTVFFSYSCFSRLDRPAVSADTSGDTKIQKLPVSGMTYLIISTPNGVTLANVTKDSLEVILRKRNEIYLDIANRQSKQRGQ